MKSLAELQAIRDKARAQISLRENSDNSIRVLVGMATCGIAGRRPASPHRFGGRGGKASA